VDPSEKFVTEGSMELGPKEDYFVFVDGEYLGKLLRTHFGIGPEPGYTSLGRLRVTVERVDGSATPGGSPAPEA
jgi:hypothetical protein